MKMHYLKLGELNISLKIACEYEQLSGFFRVTSFESSKNKKERKSKEMNGSINFYRRWLVDT